MGHPNDTYPLPEPRRRADDAEERRVDNLKLARRVARLERAYTNSVKYMEEQRNDTLIALGCMMLIAFLGQNLVIQVRAALEAYGVHVNIFEVILTLVTTAVGGYFIRRIAKRRQANGYALEDAEE